MSWGDAAWSDDRVQLLKTLWADGLSASQIAAELGGVTRNAIIGKVHRLGLPGHAKTSSTAAPQPRKTRARLPRVYRPPVVPARTYGNLAVDVQVADEPELLNIPFAQRKTLLQLNERTCRWPVGDPGSGDFFFCGGETVSALPYCAYHCRVAYQPAADRRRDKRPFRD